MDKFQLNKLYERAPVSSRQANIRQDVKASHMPLDKNARLSKIDNKINKILHTIKTKGNNPKLQKALITAKKQRFKFARKMSS